MRFEVVKTDENFPVRKLRSLPAGRWELGLTPMLFGIRIRMGLTGRFWCVLDYCTGIDLAETHFWFGYITAICYAIPEEISENDLEAVFPRQTIKPLRLDRNCQSELVTLGKDVPSALARARDRA